MKYVFAHEIDDTVKIHRDGRDVVLTLDRKWSRTLGLELLAKARERIVVGLPIDGSMVRQARTDVVRYLLELVNKAELVEHHDGRWYCESSQQYDPHRNKIQFHQCGGPLGRCDCTIPEIQLKLAW